MNKNNFYTLVLLKRDDRGWVGGVLCGGGLPHCPDCLLRRHCRSQLVFAKEKPRDRQLLRGMGPCSLDPLLSVFSLPLSISLSSPPAHSPAKPGVPLQSAFSLVSVAADAWEKECVGVGSPTPPGCGWWSQCCVLAGFSSSSSSSSLFPSFFSSNPSSFAFSSSRVPLSHCFSR